MLKPCAPYIIGPRDKDIAMEPVPREHCIQIFEGLDNDIWVMPAPGAMQDASSVKVAAP